MLTSKPQIKKIEDGKALYKTFTLSLKKRHWLCDSVVYSESVHCPLDCTVGLHSLKGSFGCGDTHFYLL